MEPLKDGSHLYEAAHRQYHLQRPGFRVSEITLNEDQAVPWHLHTRIRDTFYILDGRVRLRLRSPEEEKVLLPGDTFTVAEGRPHLVANDRPQPSTFIVLQGIGEYDFVPLA